MRPVVLFAVVALLVSACRPPGYGKGDDEPAVDAAPMPDAPTDAPAATTCDKQFRLDGHGASSTVWLTGSFTSWAGDPGAGAVELVKDGDGVWTVQKTMDAGSHQYKFIVDGNSWIADPANPNQIDDGFGGKNSVYTCSPG
jgi:hypothetical protein